jgi:hypothetical protein
MSHLRFLCLLVLLAVFITPTFTSHAHRQNSNERVVPPLRGGRRAEKTRQAISVSGVSVDPRQRLHPSAWATSKTVADSLSAATGGVGTSLDASAIFLEAPAYDSGGSNAYFVAVADLNGDGRLDLAVANLCGNNSTCADNGTVAVLLGNGDGTFRP